MTLDLAFRVDRVEQGKKRVVRTRDFYLIPNTVLSKPGVFNRALRRREDLARSFGHIEGKPLGILHPPEDEVHHGLLYLWPDEIHGFWTNPRLDKAGAIVADVALYARPDVEGHESTPAIVARNAEIADAVDAGAEIDVSGGYQTRVLYQRGVDDDGREYDEVRTDFTWWHGAIVPAGACGWSDGCGLARGAADSSHDPSTGSRDNRMVMRTEPKKDPQQGQDAKRLDELERCAKDAKAQLDELTKLVKQQNTGKGKPRADADDEPADAPEVKELRERLDRIEQDRKKDADARVGAKRAELARLRQAKADEFSDYSEAALDREIQREKDAAEKRRTRADGTRFEGEGDDARAPLTLAPTIGAPGLDGKWVGGYDDPRLKPKAGGA